MKNILYLLLMVSAITAVFLSTVNASTDDVKKNKRHSGGNKEVQLGPRPYFLVEDMDKSELKTKLQQCAQGPFYKTDFSIGHRGAALQFPEHTKESYEAAARMGAGILECDVTFTKDRELVCRHSQCDLHTTTNILSIPELAAKCSVPFQSADPEAGTPALANCCTSDITLAEFKTLCGKMDAANLSATSVEEYLDGTTNWRTDLYSTCGTILSHKESIALFKRLDVKITPELKTPSVPMPYEDDYTQQNFAQQMIDEYKEASVNPKEVYVQSFDQADLLYWIDNEPSFAKQAVYLDSRYDDPTFDHTNPATWSPDMEEIAAKGINIIAPPMWMLLTVDDNKHIVPSTYAKSAKAAGLEIITWTFERSAPLVNDAAWYHQTTDSVINNDGDKMVSLDVLAKKVGVLGVFSDWAAPVTYYANCMGIGND